MVDILTVGIAIACVVLLAWLGLRFWAKRPFVSSVLAAAVVVAYVLALSAMFLLIVPLSRWGAPNSHEEVSQFSTGTLVSLAIVIGGITPAVMGLVLLLVGLILDLVTRNRSKPVGEGRPTDRRE